MTARKVDNNQKEIVWSCRRCGVEKRPTVHQRRLTYCSRACKSALNTHVLACKICRKSFSNKFRDSVYCSVICREIGRKQSFDKTCGPKRIRRLSENGRSCPKCGERFYAPPSVKKKYCSYKCFVESGGTVRAGLAAALMMRKYGVKKDANHAIIVGAFKKAGAGILDLSSLGCGVPDLLVWCHNRWHLVEIKNRKTGYGRRGPNNLQKAWAEGWSGGPVYIVNSLDDVEAMLNGKLYELTAFGATAQ